jgi:hypothetical protein
VTWTLHDDQSVLVQSTATVDRPIPFDASASGTTPEALVVAMSEALDDAVARIVDGVVPELSHAASQRVATERSATP